MWLDLAKGEGGSRLHLAVDHALVLALATDVVHLGVEALVAERRVEDVVGVDGQQVEAALVPGRRHRVACVVRRGPRIRTARQRAVRELI